MELKKSSEIKSIAQKRLLGCWAECVSILLIGAGLIIVFILSVLMVVKFCYSYGFIDFDIDHLVSQGTVPFFVSVIIALTAVAFLAAPLNYGINWFYMQSAQGRKVPASSFFNCYFNRELSNGIIKLQLLVSLRKMIMFIPLCLLFIGEIVAAEHILKNTKDSFIYSVIICCFMLVSAGATFAYMLASMRYSLVKYIYTLNPEKPAEVIIRESAECIAGNESYILEIFLSVGLWVASCVLIFPTVYAIPYIKMTFTVAASELIEYSGTIKIEKKRSGVREDITFV